MKIFGRWRGPSREHVGATATWSPLRDVAEAAPLVPVMMTHRDEIRAELALVAAVHRIYDDLQRDLDAVFAWALRALDLDARTELQLAGLGAE